jgi:hypothetical protein
MTTAALTFPRGLNRTDKGVYSCIVENKHGSNVANITMNILCEFFFLLCSRSQTVPMIVFKHQPRILLVVDFDGKVFFLLAFCVSSTGAKNKNEKQSGTRANEGRINKLSGKISVIDE